MTDFVLPDSKLVGCAIRGLPATALDQGEEGGFKYVNCIGSYKTEPKNVGSVTFDVSRYGQHSHTIKFSDPVSEKEAIEKVEKYLSKPLTEDYYSDIVDDLFHEYPWDDAKEVFKCRGDCLTDCKFLELTYLKNSNLTFFVGS